MKRSPLFNKSIVISLLALLLLLPLSMIESKISERQNLQRSVQQEIASSASSEQTLAGPYLVVTYQELLHIQEKDTQGVSRMVTRTSDIKAAVISPHEFRLDGNSDVEIRSRGIYKARLYKLHGNIAGEFRLPRGYGVSTKLEDIIPQNAYMVMNLSDLRGILNAPQVKINGANYEFVPGSVGPLSANGVHVTLQKLDPTSEHAFKFEFPLELQGMDKFSVLPSGDNTEVKLQSSWPHPSFGGSFLPRTRTVDASGFTAHWQVPRLARNTKNMTGDGAANEVISVSFVDPVNAYLLSERSVKYGLLFVILVFTAFFLFEVLKNLRIHPMQYLLVGLALAMFFLLLISLSEHIPFALAYIISGAACVALIGAYLTGVLHKGKSALMFSGGIALLYATLYGVLQSEDNALLMGTLVMFVALAGIMLLTRRMDWYRLNAAETAESS